MAIAMRRGAGRRGYGVVSEDGSYGGDRPIAPAVLEP
jgi:hypothetical protein